MVRNPKRPRDTNQLAQHIAGIATGEITDVSPTDGKNPAAVALGRLGGKARAEALTPERHTYGISVRPGYIVTNDLLLYTRLGREASHFEQSYSRYIEWCRIRDRIDLSHFQHFLHWSRI